MWQKTTLILWTKLLFACICVQAQYSNLQKHTFSRIQPQDTVYFPVSNVNPNTIQLPDTLKADFEILPFKNVMVYHGKKVLTNVTISYRTLPTPVPVVYYKRKRVFSAKNDTTKTANSSFSVIEIPYEYEDKGLGFEFSKLNKQGSLTRGITFGNNQDLVVNSGFRLQFNGNLNKDISIVAAITDENIPIQPDGNTAQITDFNRIFIQVKGKKTTLTLGDYELRKSDGEFLRYYKNVQGARVVIEDKHVFKTWKSKELYGAVSIAKGKFKNDTFSGKEGVQGPYRLTGRNNEPFIIILAGSEKVYVNGELKQRGEQADYVIDYNAAQITFTNNCIINAYSRIVVDFEYADRNYVRTNYAFGFREQVGKKFNFELHHYTERDNPNARLEGNLNDTEKSILQKIGDTLQKAFIPAIRIDTSNKQIRYAKRDTTIGTNTYTYYYFSTNKDSAIYAITFAPTRGDYRKKQSLVNGTVFEWVAPINGVPQGEYAPVQFIVVPNSYSMTTAVAKYDIHKNWQIHSETAISNVDKNLYSSLNDEDNIGIAQHISLIGKTPFKDTTKKFLYELAFKEINFHFNAIDRFEIAEFAREWNIPTELLTIQQSRRYIANVQYVSKTQQHKLILGRFSRTDSFTANKIRIENQWNAKHLIGNAFSEYFNDTYKNTFTTWYRSIGNLTKPFKYFHFGANYIYENKVNQNIKADTLLPGGYIFKEIEPFFKNTPKQKFEYALKYNYREDFATPFNKSLFKNVANTYSAKFAYQEWDKVKFRWNNTYREFKVMDSVFIRQGLKNQQTVVSNLQIDQEWFNRAFLSATFIEYMSEREQKRQVAFVEVQPGMGTHLWNDYNQNGIQEINEFEPSPFIDRARYVRIFLLTNEFVPALSQKFGQNFNINLAKVVKGNKWYHTVVKRLSFQSNMRIEQKYLSDGKINFSLPWQVDLDNINLLSATQLFKNIFYYNRSGLGKGGFGFDIEHTHNKTKLFLSNGFETRTNPYWQYTLRTVIKQKYGFYFIYKTGQKQVFTDFAINRNFDIIQNLYEVRCNVQWNRNLRISLKQSVDQKNNRWNADSTYARVLKTGLDVKYLVGTKTNLSFLVDYAQIKYNGSTNTPIEFELLEGLRAGRNVLWNVQLNQSLTQSLQLTLMYDGRASEGTKTVHTGRMQLRLMF
ncbi:MAG: hypothetical protein RML38_03880 [Bacteroidia bacterium]|nr:hypothetical protein [Bacteroidia bacterium]